MAFTSVEFAVFLLAAVFLYYIIPQGFRWGVLLIVSYVFYLSGGIGVLGYILFTTITTYVCGCLIGNVKGKGETKEEKAQIRKQKRFFATIALVSNFGLLYFVKYWDFTLDLLRVPGDVLRFDLLLPLGISFYIFQSMGYIIDLVRGKYTPQRNFFKFALFVSFFPQLTQGPIGRYDILSPQLYKGSTLCADNIKEGTKLLVWGYIKKLVVADRCSVVACAVIDNYWNYNGSVILFGVIFYCIQLYCDFSGGIDIARGAARLFGIDMAQNFRRPFFATSLADFWRRWHITLGAWLKDYLFYPITLSKPFINFGKFTRKHIQGKAGKILPTSLATFIVYFAIGIWHGANWKYILFGCWNGALITISLLLEPYFIDLKKKLGIEDSKLWYKVACIVRTNIIVVTGRYMTRAAGVTAAWDMLLRTVTDFQVGALLNGGILALGLTMSDYLIVAAGCLLIFVLELGDELGVRITEKIEQKGAIPTFILAFVAVAIFMYFGIYRGNYIASEFIYKQF